MIIRVGTDLVKISRIEELSLAAKKKIFHESEMRKAKPEHLAGVLAVKECCKKIFGPKLDWKSVEVKRKRTGAPQVKLASSVMGKVSKIELSTSHEGGYALAFVVAQLREPSQSKRSKR